VKRASGDWNGIIEAGPAAVHLRDLRRRGIGCRRIAALSGVGLTAVRRILTGRKARIRARTSKHLLAVQYSPADAALVPAGPTWRLLQRLIADGYPKVRIARWLGQRGPGLQVQRGQVLARTARRVLGLYRRLTAEVA
jgi:hypothetical protein